MNNNSDHYNGSNRITTALLLAAGTGSRLFPLTKSLPKCLTLVNEKSILERLINNLKKQGFERLVIITGHEKECIMDFLGSESGNLTIEYINSPLYKTTNNIYSLWMARNIIDEPFVLFESDLVLNSSLLNEMMYPDRMAVAQMKPWLNGTTVSVNGLNQFILRADINCYYEVVLSNMIDDGSLSLESVSFDHLPWYEIDTLDDLAEAEKLFPIELGHDHALLEKQTA